MTETVVLPAEPTYDMLKALAGDPVILAASDEQELRRRYQAMIAAAPKSDGPAEAVKAGEEMLARYILKNMDVPEGGDDANVRFLTEILLEHRRQCEARQSAGAER